LLLSLLLLTPLVVAQQLQFHDGNNATINATLTWSQEGVVVMRGEAQGFDASSLPVGVYDLEIDLHGSDAAEDDYRVLFYDLAYSPAIELIIDDIDAGTLRGNLSGMTEAFLVDPSKLQFSSAEVSFVATGTELYKCVDYNATLRDCTGENAKIMDTVPGQVYRIPITAMDPLFSQAGYLMNQNFDASIAYWTTLNEGVTAAFSWVSSDPPQSGIAQMNITGSNKNGIGNYYQQFNLTLPPGTALAGINFSALWRIPGYSAPGTVYLWIQDAGRTITYCQANATFGAVTSWGSLAVGTGSPGCSLGNFAQNTNYTFRMRCNINTASGGSSQESCMWDNASIVVRYNDTAAPAFGAIRESADPVKSNESMNITVDIIDNIKVDSVLIEIDGVNLTMRKGSGNAYYYDGFSTARAQGLYFYRIFANDTSGNINATSIMNFTILDVTPPAIVLAGPSDGAFTSKALVAFYTVSDYTAVDTCSLAVNGRVENTSAANPSSLLNLTAQLGVDGAYLWNITCTDVSGNANTGETRSILMHTGLPQVLLSLADGSLVNSSPALRYHSYDPYLGNCTLWGNFTGTWSMDLVDLSPANNAENRFSLDLGMGTYLWNVECMDLAGNSAFNSTNLTFSVVGDLQAGDLFFSTGSPADGQALLVFANITNNAGSNESAVVEFWDGDPADGGTLIGSTSILLGPYGHNLTNVSWTATLGLHNLFAIVDPLGQIVEYDESNNALNQTLLVPIWQVYYGNITGGVDLAPSENSSFLRWTHMNKSGNVFITDSDTTDGISFTALAPVGRNRTGGIDPGAADDFEEIDLLLNTEGFADNVNRSYTAGNAPVAVTAFTVYGNYVADVPVIKSYDDGFITGLLWDTSDCQSPSFTAAERPDIVFVTRIRNMTQSSYGPVDYEIRVPAQLVNYKGSGRTVTFYYELQ
jgi:hypothetical protein